MDANLLVDAFRSEEANPDLRECHRHLAPFELLGSIVVQELRSGVQSGRDLRSLEKHVLAPFIRRERIVTPSARAWAASGDVLRALARDGIDLGRMSRSLAYDVLLALSCRDAGLVLVTQNLRDFERIARVTTFAFTAPWPKPIA